MNYTELKTALQDYAQTTETSFVTNIDTFIGQAENRIFLEIDLPDFRKASLGKTSDVHVLIAQRRVIYQRGLPGH